MKSIRELLEPYPRALLSVGSTPIHELPRLSSHLEQNIYIMREDLTGFAIGGNKVRKLEYLVGDALAKNADVLVTTAATNFSRNAAAAAKAVGLEIHIVIVGEEHEQNSASQALFQEFGAHLHFLPAASKDELREETSTLIDELTWRGRIVYELHPGGSDPIGSLAYLNAFQQIVDFAGCHFHRIFVATGSTATQVGLVLGQSVSGYDTSIIGVAVSQPREIQLERVSQLAQRTAHMLKIPVEKDRILVDDAFLAPGYPIPSDEGRAAVELFASREGILLDQVYTGKVAAALIAYAERGLLSNDENVLFIHTGGNAGLYY